MKWSSVIPAFLLLSPLAAPADDAALQFFETRVRPVLSANCYSCHGAEKQKGNLRVDHISAILKGGDYGPAIVKGDPAASRLLTAIHYMDVDLQMPPAGKLADEAIKDIETWIAAGAYWPDEPFNESGAKEDFDLQARRAAHWAWQPVKHPTTPVASKPEWARDPVDQFVLAGLDAQALSPAPEADKATLLRRLYFDLIGLPPSPEIIEAFVHDTAPDAYERRVDELLASTHFGERWGRHWLDLTRYAETHGHEGDYLVPHAWQYRDYVIRAFNGDVPYDQIIREHIAGDVLSTPRIDPNGVNESILATGFWFMYQATHGPVDVKLDHADRIDNQIDVMTKTFTAMTVSCARCHDHKFDAISDEDYYALSGILRNTRPRVALLDPKAQTATAVAALKYEHDRGTRLLEQVASEIGPQQRIADYMLAAQSVLDGADPAAVAQTFQVEANHLERWRKALRDRDNRKPGHPLYAWARASGMSKYEPVADEAPGAIPTMFENFDGALEGWSREGQAFGDGVVQQAAWRPGHKDLRFAPTGVVHSGLLGEPLQGVLRSPTFTLDCSEIHVRAAGRFADVKLVIENYTLRDQNALLFEETAVTPDSDDFKWYRLRHRIEKFRGCKAYFEIRDLGGGYIAVDEIRFANAPSLPGSDTWRALDEKLAGGAGPTQRALAYQTAFEEAATRWRDGNAGASEATALTWLLEHDLIGGTNIVSRAEIAAAHLREQANAVPAPLQVLAMDEASAENQPVFIRGSYKNLGDVVDRRFLAALDSNPAQYQHGSGRMALAEALTDPSNPLVARVMVNRVWHHLFGRGIVPSVDNFGMLGEKPSHPELLDYLATRFIDEGWSIKTLIRNLVCSSTYRMSSEAQNVVAEEKDPANVWLHRMPLKRLQSEAIRDSILAVAGTLDPQTFGPSIPAWISPHVKNMRAPQNSGPMDGARRRSIYMEVRRNFLSPMLTAFDFPLPDTSHGKRNVSNVPAQALILMNDPFVVDQAQQWCARLCVEEALPARRVRRAYEEAIGRVPSREEFKRAMDFLKNISKDYELSLAEGLQDGRVWTDFCHVLFMSKEFIFIG